MNRALATIDLQAIRDNVASLKQRLSPRSSLMAVVKASGYGHGAVPVARACLESGAEALGVATIDEARELREAELAGRLIILGPLAGADIGQAFELGAEVVAWSFPFLKELALTGHSLGRSISTHVKVDTGMHRLGLAPRQLPSYLDAVETSPEVKLAGLMTHFATADSDEDYFSYQLGAFEEATQVVLRTGTKAQYHCANSAATIRYPASHFDMVRCGIAIYGLSPFQGNAADDGLAPSLKLSSLIVDIRKLAEGDSVGYGRSWISERDTYIGVVPIGYADGISRRLSNSGQVLAGGRRCPIVGRISMDQLTIDLGPDPRVKQGDEVVLIGSQGSESITAEAVASVLDTINYEITCVLTPRVKREYLP